MFLSFEDSPKSPLRASLILLEKREAYNVKNKALSKDDGRLFSAHGSATKSILVDKEFSICSAVFALCKISCIFPSNLKWHFNNFARSNNGQAV